MVMVSITTIIIIAIITNYYYYIILLLVILSGDGSIPRVVAGPRPPPPSVSNPCRAGFVSNLCHAAVLYDGPCRVGLVAKTRLCYKLCRARGAAALLQSRRF